MHTYAYAHTRVRAHTQRSKARLLKTDMWPPSEVPGRNWILRTSLHEKHRLSQCSNMKFMYI